MKKTVLALSFALCASFAFAQTKNVATQKIDGNKAAEFVSWEQIKEANFNASIFTKDNDSIVKEWDFSPECVITTGTVSTPGSDSTTFILPDGTQIRQANHASTEAYAQWVKLDSAGDARVLDQDVYPWFAQVNQNFLTRHNQTFLQFRFDTARTHTTSHNGMMFMSMSDGAPNETAPLNAYFNLGTVNTQGRGIVDIRFFQFYQNYYDECYIDYRAQGAANWNTLPINVDGVDVEVNGTLYGWSTYTLPINGVVNQDNLELRIRYYSLHRGSAYGYIWALDDVSMIEGDADRWMRWRAQYSEGAYQMMPEGMELPLLWYSKVKNNGVNAKENVSTSIYNYNKVADETTLIMSKNQANVPANASVQVTNVMDPAGYTDGIEPGTPPEYFGWYQTASHTPAPGKNLNTTGAGIKHAVSSIKANNKEEMYDTIAYRLLVDEENGGIRTWGYDNGILSRFQFFGYGVEESGRFLTDTGHFANSGYRVTNRYTTGNVVPENWVLRGVELVVNTEPGMTQPRAQIAPVVFQDQYSEDGVRFAPVTTGAGAYAVKATDYSSNDQLLSTTGYLQPGAYTTIRLMFPEQPELEPNTSYRLGYQLMEDGQFAVAANTNYYVVKHTRADGNTIDSAVYYSESEDMAVNQFKHFFSTNSGYGLPNPYSVLIVEPGAVESPLLWGVSCSGAPMIRALVGPKVDLPTYDVNITCEGNEDAGVSLGMVQYGDGEEDWCGQTAQVPEGSFAAFYIVPEDGYMVSEIQVDGEVIEEGEEESYEAVHYVGDNEDGSHYDYWVVELKDVHEAHTIHAVYAEGSSQGIDPVDPSVRMKLQPNPATSQVRLSLSGVEGMVNCSLIDMSGRVVFNTTMNAENAEVIDLSNVAKGAYFVRITNNQFSKIEKLIVR